MSIKFKLQNYTEGFYLVRCVLKYFQVAQSPWHTMSHAGGKLLLVFLGWLFGYLWLSDFLNCCKTLSCQDFFSVDSTKLWVRTISEDFSTVLNKIFLNSLPLCAVCVPYILDVFSLSFNFLKNVHLVLPEPLDCPYDLYSLFTIFYMILKWWNFLPYNFIQWSDSHRMSLLLNFLYCHQYGIDQTPWKYPSLLDIQLSFKRHAFSYILQKWPLKMCYLIAWELNIFLVSTFSSLVIAYVKKCMT